MDIIRDLCLSSNVQSYEQMYSTRAYTVSFRPVPTIDTTKYRFVLVLCIIQGVDLGRNLSRSRILRVLMTTALIGTSHCRQAPFTYLPERPVQLSFRVSYCCFSSYADSVMPSFRVILGRGWGPTALFLRRCLPAHRWLLYITLLSFLSLPIFSSSFFKSIHSFQHLNPQSLLAPFIEHLLPPLHFVPNYILTHLSD